MVCASSAIPASSASSDRPDRESAAMSIVSGAALARTKALISSSAACLSLRRFIAADSRFEECVWRPARKRSPYTAPVTKPRCAWLFGAYSAAETLTPNAARPARPASPYEPNRGTSGTLWQKPLQASDGDRTRVARSPWSRSSDKRIVTLADLGRQRRFAIGLTMIDRAPHYGRRSFPRQSLRAPSETPCSR